jgi:hypothetical protein
MQTKSPFPGMDPYLERFWSGVHSRIAVYICDAINAQLPADLQADISQSLLVETYDSHRRISADVYVEESSLPARSASEESFASSAAHSGTASLTDVAVAQPEIITVSSEPLKLRHIEIIDRARSSRIVTAIEILSPANKQSESGVELYQKKQREYLDAGVNLIEIDLIRAGRYVLAAPFDYLRRKSRMAPYRICIARATKPFEFEMYPLAIQEPLPNIRLPLRPTDRDIILQLQPVLDECYLRGRYNTINYQEPLELPFSDEDRAWISDRLKQVATGVRSSC